MSNKTSDKNVVNDIKILKKFCEYEEAVVLTDNALEEVQDAINNILAEREQDKKRIQELEAENKALELQNKQLEYYIEELKKYNKTVSDRIIEYKKNSISKQKIKDKIGVLEMEENTII